MCGAGAALGPVAQPHDAPPPGAAVTVTSSGRPPQSQRPQTRSCGPIPPPALSEGLRLKWGDATPPPIPRPTATPPPPNSHSGRSGFVPATSCPPPPPPCGDTLMLRAVLFGRFERLGARS